MGTKPKYCMLWPAVRVPNVPPGDKFFFVYPKMGASKPEKVVYLQPGKWEVKKMKTGGKFALKFKAPQILKGDKFGKPTEFQLVAASQKNRDQWTSAFK